MHILAKMASPCALPVLNLTREQKIRLHLTKSHPIPPKLRSQIGKDVMKNVVLLDNDGDGYCGYHCLGVINYLVKHSYVEYRDIVKRLRDTAEEKLCAQNLRLMTGQAGADGDIAVQLEGYLKAPAHELESCEISWYLRDYGINVGVIGYSTEGARRNYQVQIPLYHPDNAIWIFFLNSNRVHWELLAKKFKGESKTDTLCLAFTLEEAFHLIESLSGSVPETAQMDETIIVQDLVELKEELDDRPAKPEPEPELRPPQKPKRRRSPSVHSEDDADFQLALVLSASLADQ